MRTSLGWMALLIAPLAIAWPWIAGDFWVSALATRVLIIGTMALSLTFLTSMTGMVSFAQAAIAAVAGYTLALLSANTSGVGTVMPLTVAVGAAVAAGLSACIAVGALSLRSSGIYLLMITLAISMTLFFFVSQNVTVFNGFDGINGVRPPIVAGVDFSQRAPFYLLCLGVAATCLGLCAYIEETPLGSALHGLRNAPRRMQALGHNTTALRLVAWAFAGLIASAAGILNVWYTGQVSPGATDVGAASNLLIVAVIGGIRRPSGAYVGALFFVLLETFAIDLIDRERFNLVIGITFILVVMFLADGLTGLPALARKHFRRCTRQIDAVHTAAN